MRAVAVMWAVVSATLLAAPLTVSAEEWAASAADTPEPVRRAAKKPVVKKKPAPAPVLPSAPVPYTSLKPTIPAAKVPVTSRAPLPPIAKSEPVAAVAVAGEAALPEPPPPPPPPAPPTVIVNLNTPPPSQPASGEIVLKCDTTTSGQGSGSSGSFYLSLIRSDAFPDSGADFKVISIDPDHGSLIRDTLCFSFRCNASVRPAYYELVDQQYKKGGYFKISLNRATGAFHGQRQTEPGRFGLGASQTLSERGTCHPQKTETATLF